MMRTFGLSERTKTLNDCVARMLGEPLSVTTTLKKFDVPELFVVVSHAMTPLFVLIVAPPGAVRRLKVSCCAGTSASLATLVTERVSPPLRKRLVSADKVGGVLAAWVGKIPTPRTAIQIQLLNNFRMNYRVALIR